MIILITARFFFFFNLIISVLLNPVTTISDSQMLNAKKVSLSVIEKTNNIAAVTKKINVLDFGAKGDGETDDTVAIQKAIYYAAKNKSLVLLPPTDSHYLITSPVTLVGNTHIWGYGATLYMEPQSTPSSIFYSDDDEYISNITVEGLNLLSNNTKEGTGLFKNTLVSNVEGICIYGIKNLTLKNIKMDNMLYGLKLGENAKGTLNKDITIENLKIYNSRMPIYATSTDTFKISDSTLDANGGSDQRLHCAYIDGNTSNFYFDHVVLKNSSGGGIHIYHESDSKKASKNMVFANCTIENCKVGAYIWSGAEDIEISNTSIKKCDLAFSINNTNRLKISNIFIGNFSQRFIGGKGAFEITCCNDSMITNIAIDCNTMKGSLFELSDDINGLLISYLNVNNMNDCDFFYTTSQSIKGLVVENSIFEWRRITKAQISFRGTGSEVLFRYNKFINNSRAPAILCDNYTDTHVTMQNNMLNGLKMSY